MKIKYTITLLCCLLITSCTGPKIIQYNLSKDKSLEKHKCIKTKYNSILIQDIGYCFGPIISERKSSWKLRYYGKKSVSHFLYEKYRYKNRKPPKGICTNPSGHNYTNAVILPKGSHILIEELWTREADYYRGQRLGFIGKTKIDKTEYKFKFRDSQFLHLYTDGKKTYNNYETQMYYEIRPYRSDKLVKLKRISSKKATASEYLDELYDRCD